MEPSPYAILPQACDVVVHRLGCLYLRRAALRLRILAHREPELADTFQILSAILNVVIMTVVLSPAALRCLARVDASKSGEKTKALRMARRHMVSRNFAILHIREMGRVVH